MKTRKMPIRLALRHEGHFWNAYMAMTDSMENAKLIGSIAMGAVTKDVELRDRFKQLMMDVLQLAIVEVTGVEPDEWTEQPAPDKDRSGHA